LSPQTGSLLFAGHPPMVNAASPATSKENALLRSHEYGNRYKIDLPVVEAASDRTYGKQSRNRSPKAHLLQLYASTKG